MTKNLLACVSNDALTGILYMQSFNYITCGFENNFNYKDKSFNECPDSHAKYKKIFYQRKTRQLAVSFLA